ncbi:hypothetical protein E9993_17935 [Labilibacter sediminis]|nr:hypothetical protein E9993_17935 [Labilibacter sediminis]
MEQNNILSALFLFFGVLIFLASILNWSYFFKQRKAQILIRFFGINGARIFYALLGCFFALLGADHLFNLKIFSF